MTQNPRRITRSRAWSALVLCAAYACLTSASAMGATHARTPLRQMFGNAVVESTVDHNSAGRAEAFPFMAAKSGTVTQLDVYVDRRNGARVISRASTAAVTATLHGGWRGASVWALSAAGGIGSASTGSR